MELFWRQIKFQVEFVYVGIIPLLLSFGGCMIEVRPIHNLPPLERKRSNTSSHCGKRLIVTLEARRMVSGLSWSKTVMVPSNSPHFAVILAAETTLSECLPECLH